MITMLLQSSLKTLNCLKLTRKSVLVPTVRFDDAVEFGQSCLG